MITFKKFEQLAQDYNLITLETDLIADMETPVSVYQRFRDEAYSFLLESVEGQERWAQYSFIGFRPLAGFRSRQGQVETCAQSGVWKAKESKQPLDELQKLLDKFRLAPFADLPRFAGGAVGYLGYDMIQFMERMPQAKQTEIDPWDSFFIVPQVLLVFDNRAHRLRVLYHVPVTAKTDLKAAYRDAKSELKSLVSHIEAPCQPPQASKPAQSSEFKALWNKKNFTAGVKRIQEYIQAGDCIQTVLSLRFQAKYSGDNFNIYRALRRLNPSPYLYYLHMDDHDVVGASPETLVRLEGENLMVRPIAGTRPRGKNEMEDLAMEQELLADPKERAEHIMLVDLGRNDLGRVAKKETVQVNELMVIERYSHVMHIVSNVQATLAKKCGALDVMKATFPAGTLSGAPKIRAMEIIYELEPTRRGIYGGCIGYIDFNGNMDTAIAIRTAVVQGDTVSVQAGAGIVLDSVPEKEYEECLNKAKGVMRAVELAQKDF